MDVKICNGDFITGLYWFNCNRFKVWILSNIFWIVKSLLQGSAVCHVKLMLWSDCNDISIFIKFQMIVISCLDMILLYSMEHTLVTNTTERLRAGNIGKLNIYWFVTYFIFPCKCIVKNIVVLCKANVIPLGWSISKIGKNNHFKFNL